MSGPYGTQEPPAILIAWSFKHSMWRATAVMAGDDAELTAIEGESTSLGDDPASALQQLLGRYFAARTPADFPPTLISVEMVELPADALDRGAVVMTAPSAGQGAPN